jgi:hypothetical protein
MLSITTFGAIPDDRSQAARTKNAEAWLAAMKAMGTVQAPRANILLISGGEFFFPGSVFMTRPCIIQGEGGSSNSISKLTFPYNRAGIIADFDASPDDPGKATWGKIENLDINNEGPSSIVQRRLNWKYTPGDIVISPGNNNLMFKCTVGGITIELPSRFDNANIDQTIQESNGTTWLALAKAELKISLWQPDTQYGVGDIVFSNGFDLAGRHYGDSRFTYVCTAPGTSGDQDPFGAQTLDTEVREINGPTWRVNVWSAILMRSSIHVDNISTYRWPNAAIHINARDKAPIPNNANWFTLTNLKSVLDGMGIYTADSDANGGFIGYCRVQAPGQNTPGLGGHGFWDHSLSSNVWIGNYAEAGTGAACINDSVGKTTWINNISEMILPSIVRQGQATSLGNSPWHPTMLQALSHFDSNDGRGFYTTDCTSRVTVFTARGANGKVDSFSTTDDQGNDIARFYNFDARRRGWYTDHYYGQNGAFMGGISSLMAEEGPGHIWTLDGTFIGGFSTEKRYFGYDPFMWTSNRLREGKRNRGDMFIIKPYAGSGEWMGITVTQPGTKGISWTKDTDYYQKRVGLPDVAPRWNFPAVIVEPGDGYAYACTRSGKSGMSAPPFTQNTIIGVNAPVWSRHTGYWPGTDYWPGSKVRPTTANGHYYQMKQYPNWKPNTPVSPNQIITTGDSNGNLFFAYVQTWVKNSGIYVGQHRQPTSLNGKVYRVKRVTEPLRPLGTTGNQEPNWSLLSQPTDELTDGSVVWQLGQLVTGSSEPPGKNENNQQLPPGWDTRASGLDRAGGITYDNNIEWYSFVPRTGNVEPTWNTVSGSETIDTPGATTYFDPSPNINAIVVQPGFGVVWVESGLEPADSKVLDGTCEWTRIDTVPVTANILPVGAANTVGAANAPTMSLTLNQLSLTNVDDAAGRWQFEGGEVFQENRHIANYASTKRVVIQGTEAQNTAMLTMTLFFIGQPQQPTENITLQGNHDFGSGEEIGSVSAASSAFASYIGKQFKRSGTALLIQ